MDTDQSDILWSQTSAEAFSSDTLQDYIDADLVVIGAGYTGLSAALEAATRGAKVVVVEARNVGHGGSGRNVGLVNAGLWLPPNKIRSVLGDSLGDKLSHSLGAAPDLVYGLIDKHSIACDPMRKGTLHCAHSAAGLADLQDRHAQLSAMNAPVELLGADEAGQRTGAAGQHGALFDPRAGTIQPMAYARGLARAAREAGAQIFEETPALSLGWEDSKWEAATPTGVVRAKSLLIATGAYPFKMSWVHPMKAVPVYYFQAATVPLSDAQRAQILPGGEGCWDTAMVMSSWRLDAQGRLLIGGMGQLTHVASGVHRAWVRRKIARLFPALKGIELETIWEGRIGMTNEKLPKIWRFGPKAYACFGYSGRGIAPGTLFGNRIAASFLEDAEDLLPLVPVNDNSIRYMGLRGAFFEAGATLVHSYRDYF